MDKITIPELLTFKYLTESLRPFRTIYKQFWKNLKVEVLHDAPVALKTLAYELTIRFILIFIRDHRSVWMGFENEPLDKLFSSEELKTICDRWGINSYATAIIRLNRWLCKRFKQSLSKEEMNLLVEDFERALNDTLELIISAKLFYTTIRAGLKTGALRGEEIIEFLDSNKESSSPQAYDRSINLLSKFQSQRKSVGDALVQERNYLSRHGLFAHLHRIEEATLEKFFLDTLKTHATKMQKAVGESANEWIGWAHEVYYGALSRFKRQAAGSGHGHFEHYLNATLLGERKHALANREKIILRDDLSCPFCGYDLRDILKGKTSGSVECPSCKISVGVWAFRNDLVPMSELPESFFRDSLDPKGSTYRVRTFTPTIGEEDFSDVLDRRLWFDVSLTEKELAVIDSIREADDQGVSMSGVLRRIASEQGKSENTVREHYKNALKKLKNLHQKK